MRPAADDDSVTCQNTRVDKCSCRQVDIQYVLHLMMTLRKYIVNKDIEK